MAVAFGNYFRALVWALVGSLLLGVFFYPLGGAGGLVGLNFMVYNLIGVYIVSLILHYYPTTQVPFFKRFLGYQGVESTTLFVLAIEGCVIAVYVVYWILGVIVSFLHLWTVTVGSGWAVAHFIVSAAVVLYTWHRSRRLDEPGTWYLAPIVIILFLLLVPMAYEGLLFQ